MPFLRYAASMPASSAARGKSARLRAPTLVGSSEAMRRVLATIERVARFKTTVLLLGESGVGKELVARAIHMLGPRRGAPFVPVNCASLGRDLLENELFGHERGAFTGAGAQKKGLFEIADRGTLVLDEIGEMDPSTQARLLRVLERSEFRRVGGTRKLHVDVNVVAATNRDLRDDIAAGRFREDLYYRLKVVTIVVPPLRERREDIPALVEAFLRDFHERSGRKIRGLTPEAMRRLTDHGWPGNVRELKNYVESAAMLADGDVLDEADFDGLLEPTPPARGRRGSEGRHTAPAAGASAVPPSAVGEELRFSWPARIHDVERALILETVKRTRSRREAALALGIGLRTLYAKLQSYEAVRS
jgi:DNA-binding NtrC family response regulator